MIHHKLIHPESIVIVGGSNNIHKPGGKILNNIIEGKYTGTLFVVNPNENTVQGINCYHDVNDLPDVDLAILIIPAKLCPEVVECLATKKNTRGFIIISAGFSEENKEGADLEKHITEIINKAGGSLIGPNCIGVLNYNYHGVFTSPIPKLERGGCDLVSSSGATAVYILESGIPKGLAFSSVISIGNSAQIGVEEILEYWDNDFDPELDSRIKLLYIESIKNPEKLLKHSSSLIRKGCQIAAIKSGISEEGSRAASSHTGAIANSDLAVEALFRKAGIVRCNGREELTTVASIFRHKRIHGKKFAIITHAGGPAIMLTDALSQGGLEIPTLEGPLSENLLNHLPPGSSVKNPIDILATGTVEQLDLAIEYCDKKFDNIDAMIVIFGSTGLTEIFDAYETLHQKIQSCIKPVFPILPSISSAKKEVEFFIAKGHVNFPDEVSLGRGLAKVYNTPRPAKEKQQFEGVEEKKIREILESQPDGFMEPHSIKSLLEAAKIPTVNEFAATSKKQILEALKKTGFPLVLKVIGPIHKTDIGGVVLNINDKKHLLAEYKRMMEIKNIKGVLVQPMMKGIELFAGAHYEQNFGHMILCGLGGIFVEVLRDVSAGLEPLTFNEASSMIRSLKSYKIIHGTRGQKGTNEHLFAEIIVRLSHLLHHAPEIKEMDLNPLIGTVDEIVVVDARIRIER